jgi:hypothetical protein
MGALGETWYVKSHGRDKGEGKVEAGKGRKRAVND